MNISPQYEPSELQDGKLQDGKPNVWVSWQANILALLQLIFKKCSRLFSSLVEGDAKSSGREGGHGWQDTASPLLTQQIFPGCTSLRKTKA